MSALPIPDQTPFKKYLVGVSTERQWQITDTIARTLGHRSRPVQSIGIQAMIEHPDKPLLVSALRRMPTPIAKQVRTFQREFGGSLAEAISQMAAKATACEQTIDTLRLTTFRGTVPRKDFRRLVYGLSSRQRNLIVNVVKGCAERPKDTDIASLMRWVHGQEGELPPSLAETTNQLTTIQAASLAATR